MPTDKNVCEIEKSSSNSWGCESDLDSGAGVKIEGQRLTLCVGATGANREIEIHSRKRKNGSKASLVKYFAVTI